MSADLKKLNVICDLRAFANGREDAADLMRLAVLAMNTPTGSYVFWSEVATRLREMRAASTQSAQRVLLDGLLGTFAAEAEGVAS